MQKKFHAGHDRYLRLSYFHDS